MNRICWTTYVSTLSILSLSIFLTPLSAQEVLKNSASGSLPGSSQNASHIVLAVGPNGTIEETDYARLRPGQAYAIADPKHPHIYQICLRGEGKQEDIILQNAREVPNRTELARKLEISQIAPAEAPSKTDSPPEANAGTMPSAPPTDLKPKTILPRTNDDDEKEVIAPP